MRFEDLKPGDIFTMEVDYCIKFEDLKPTIEVRDCRFLKTQNLYYFNEDTDSQKMEAINAVKLDDGQFIYVARGMEVEKCG